MLTEDIYSEPLSADIELMYLRGYFIFALVAYTRWALLVVNAICGYLGIQCLRITPKGTPPGVLNGIAKERAH